jgi:predicted protein tyrosine phosphatase
MSAPDNPRQLKVLFVCSQNRLRSPTADKVFSADPRLEVRSAGVDRDAIVPITRELLEWADVIFVMEKRHRNAIHRSFKDIYQRKRIICLYIPDVYDYMDPELVQLLEHSVASQLEPFLSALDAHPMADRP